jgi:hypothetical protein
MDAVALIAQARTPDFTGHAKRLVSTAPDAPLYEGRHPFPHASLTTVIRGKITQERRGGRRRPEMGLTRRSAAVARMAALADAGTYLPFGNVSTMRRGPTLGEHFTAGAPEYQIRRLRFRRDRVPKLGLLGKRTVY